MSASIFVEIAQVLGVGTLLALVMYVLRLPLMLGYLLTGIVVGPLGLHVIQNESALQAFSQLGVSSLLFIVGLHLAPSVLRDVGRPSFVAGTLQALVMVGLTAFGLSFIGVPWKTGALYGLLIAFNSTIIITKLLSDKRELGRLYGKLTIGVLLLQDVFATMAITWLPTMAGASSSGSDAPFALLAKLITLLVGVVVVAWALLPRLSMIFARSQEFLFLFSLSWGIGLAALFYALGLSMEVGALVAGVALASSPYHYEISSRMKVIRDFFLILFFVLLGSHISLQGIESWWPIAGILTGCIFIISPLSVFLAYSLQGFHPKVSFPASISFTQVSEFSLILLFTLQNAGLIESQQVALLATVTLITMLLSPFLIQHADQMYVFFAPLLQRVARRNARRDRVKKEQVDILLFGCHRVGSDFLPTLLRKRQSLLVVDFDPGVIESLTARNIPCRYGDIGDREFLSEFDFKHVKMLICTVPDLESNLVLLRLVRRVNPRAVVMTMAHAVDEALILYEEGASYVVMPYYLGGNYSTLLVDKFGTDHKRFSHERKHHMTHLIRRTKENASEATNHSRDRLPQALA